MEKRDLVVLFATLLVGCAGERAPRVSVGCSPIPLGRPSPALFATTTTLKYDAGQLERIAPDGGVKTFPTHSDAIVRVFSDYQAAFVVNRGGRDSIQIMDSEKLLPLAEFSVGKGMNLQDIALGSDGTAYVTALTATALYKVDLAKCQVGSQIAIDFMKDPDGTPEMSNLLRWKDSLYIAIQRLDRNQGSKPAGLSQLAILDTHTDLSKTYPLLRTNPVQMRVGPDDKIYIAEAGLSGFYSALDGGIERWNPLTQKSEGIIVEEATLGGDLIDFEILRNDLGVAVVADKNFQRHLVGFNPLSRTRVELKLPNMPSSQALVKTHDSLLLADQDPKQFGVHSFDLLSFRHTGKMATQLGPYHLEVVE